MQTPSYGRKSAKIHAARHLCFAGPAFILKRVIKVGYVPCFFRFRNTSGDETDLGVDRITRNGYTVTTAGKVQHHCVAPLALLLYSEHTLIGNAD